MNTWTHYINMYSKKHTLKNPNKFITQEDVLADVGVIPKGTEVIIFETLNFGFLIYRTENNNLRILKY